MSTRELSSLWSAPTDLPIGDVGKAVRCLATTYTFDAAYFERELLPRFLGLRYDDKEDEQLYLLERDSQLGTVPTSVLVDARMVSSEQSTLRWDQIPVFVPQGIQHAKISILVWERAVRVLIGSANLTGAAYRTNREMMAVLDFFDGQSSRPYALLIELLDFVIRIGDLTRCADELKQRIRLQMSETKRLAKSWSAIREAFTPNERPRVHFVPGFPAIGARKAERVLDSALAHWGSRSVSDVVLITPFVDESEARQSALCQRIAGLSGVRSANVTVLLPAERVAATVPSYQIQVPASFGKAVCAVWPDYEWTELVLPLQPGEFTTRALHAKALLLQSDATALMLMGSSNFTSRGMGTHRPNIEANLCYIDESTERDSRSWQDRLPVSEGEYQVESDATVSWLEQAPIGDGEDSSIGLLPPFFSFATISASRREADEPMGGTLRLEFDLRWQEPSVWRISTLNRGDLESSEVARSLEGQVSAKIEWSLPANLHPTIVRVLQVSWRDDANDSERVALLPVGLRTSTDLPWAVDYPALSADEIMANLIAGRDLAGHAAARGRQSQLRGTGPTILDPLRTVNAEGYMLYRTRRLGRALARVGARLADTPSTPSAMAYRLMVDPLGVVSLARAICRQQREDERSRKDESAVQGAVFALAELILMLGHAGKAAQERARDSGLTVLPIFREAAHVVHEYAVAAASPRGPGEQIQGYLTGCVEQSAKLLRGTHATTTE